MGYQTFIKSQYGALSIGDVLRGAPTVLLGVHDVAAAALAGVGVKTVFDLSVSAVFDGAARVVASAANPRSVLRRYGRGPASLIDDGALLTDTAELPYAGIVKLAGIDAATAAALEQALAVATIRDLALWPPFLAAKSIVLEAYNPDLGLEIDPEAPVELIPRSGEFGTERHLYSTLVMFPGPFEAPPQSLDGMLFDMTANPAHGFELVRYGARLTYAHTWNPIAVAKGHLLHSLPLAPGESTSVAVIDWSSKSSAATSQSLSESERLSSSNDRARTVSQIASSVASEFTRGASVTATESTSVAGGVGGILGFFAGSASGAANQQTAVTHTVSTGDRNIATNLQDNIRDSTQQVSSALRNQRAASVSEVNQTQSEHLSTRSVTNYNHMHALTVQYYEVVQVYETQTRLQDAERCIFLPMRPIDFTDERNILRYLPILKDAALDGTTRNLLAELEEETASGFSLTFPHDRLPQVLLGPFFPLRLDFVYGPRLQANARSLARDGFIVFNGSVNAFTIDYRLQLDAIRWPAVRPGQPITTPILGVSITLEDGTVIDVSQSAADDADPGDVDPVLGNGSPLSFGRIARIGLKIHPDYMAGQQPQEHFIHFELAVRLGSDARWLDCGFLIDSSAADLAGSPLITVTAPSGLAELGAVLNEDRLYYSRQIWLREDPQTRIMQLAPFRLDVGGGTTINLVDHLSPQPLEVVGNYLVYRFTYEQNHEWQEWKKRYADRSAATDVDVVAVPTGGVFAEAVLGRANSAEKLDLTRFFDWADSPPPAPPAIQALQAGTHTPAEAPNLGTFDTPLVSIQQPVALPDPVGLSSVLTAITTSDAFRNMSGLAATGDAANEALDASGKASIGALQAAGTALATTLDAFAQALSAKKPEDKTLSEAGAAANQKAAATKAAATNGGSPADLVRTGLVQKVLADMGLATDGGTPDGGTDDGGTPDAGLLNSTLVTDPMFADVGGFVTLLQLLSDDDLISGMVKRFTGLDKSVDPLTKYRELVDEITTRSATLRNPSRFLYAAAFVKTGVLPADTDFGAADVTGVRASALRAAVARILDTAKTINKAGNASTALTAILEACASGGVTNLNHVSYVLATAHHESRMGAAMTEIGNGLSTATVFTADAYFFEAVPGGKSSYNTLAGNVRAGDRLKADGVIQASPDVQAWNGTTYPAGQPVAIKIAARRCDFLTFIGRGYAQITGRANYAKFSKRASLGNIDFVAEPLRVLEPPAAAGIMVQGMRGGEFRGNHKLADYDVAAGFDATNARDIINGDKATYGASIRDIAKKYKAALVFFPKLDESSTIV
ncbi:hypothetical protein [Dactylosporangium sp. CA-139066]|uniref:hypothetical protein n=1 Tax=Dactylosporangium sp. CA-139066 TaxID=3239930 RepID=UPI003D9007BB